MDIHYPPTNPSIRAVQKSDPPDQPARTEPNRSKSDPIRPHSVRMSDEKISNPTTSVRVSDHKINQPDRPTRPTRGNFTLKSTIFSQSDQNRQPANPNRSNPTIFGSDFGWKLLQSDHIGSGVGWTPNPIRPTRVHPYLKVTFQITSQGLKISTSKKKKITSQYTDNTSFVVTHVVHTLF